jgi:asparagine synthase (glutamine-hydrolysing)
MCGIAGKACFGNGTVRESELLLMAKKIEHRGPDDTGIYISEDKKVGLINRRLAIIDLTKAGHQPLSYSPLQKSTYSNGKYWITFNGEIYNFLDQRQKLSKEGYKFVSNTDTEVILALYDRYKTGCLTHLRGMFAFAIYDTKEKTLFLARDRVGKKPLKYYWNGNIFIFASELKAILTQKEVHATPEWSAIYHYLTYGYVPSPRTGFKNIYKLEPGHYMLFDLKTGALVKRRYWKPDFSQKLNLSEGEWCKKILEELEEATKLRMIADVPIGAFLSGGVDSSSVVATMARLSAKPIKTFTIGFKETKSDERVYAQKIARLYHTDHTTLLAEPESIEELLPKLAYFYEEPFADSSSIVTYMVCKLASKFVKVVLTGDGGDENFGGYDGRMWRLKRDVALDNYLRIIRPITIPVISFFANKLPNPAFTRIGKFLEKSKMPIADRYVTYNCYFTNEDKEILCSDELEDASETTDWTPKKWNSFEIARDKFRESGAKDLRDQALYFDLVSWLPDSQLTKVDIASMSVSIEARSPFLDQRIIELACQVPFDLKVRSGEYKYILKKAVEKIVPKENLYRKKMGFSIPLSKWFTGDLNKYARKALLSKKAFIKTFTNEDYIKMMLSKHTPNTDYGPKLWSLLALELWFRTYFQRQY